MPKFNPNDYEMVEDRLKKFWKDNPNGRVWTEVVKTSDDGSMVIVKAMVYSNKEDANPVATGIAQEVKGQGGFANADAWMENCETSAIGRALANWKYQGNAKKRPSKEEMSKVEVEKKPVAEPTKAEEEAMNKVVDEMVNTKSVADQINEILNGGGYEHLTAEEIKDHKKSAYDTCVNSGSPSDVNDWTKGQVSTFFEMFDLISSNPEEEIIKEVFGEITNKKVCPECSESDYIEDNRDKKESDPKYSKIPDFACSNYGDNNGCGKGWYIGNEDFPSGWI
jgi:hypothetical protein